MKLEVKPRPSLKHRTASDVLKGHPYWLSSYVRDEKRIVRLYPDVMTFIQRHGVDILKPRAPKRTGKGVRDVATRLRRAKGEAALVRISLDSG